MHGRLLVSLLYPFALSFKTSCCQGLSWIPRKAILLDNYQVELVFEEISTSWASMTIINSKVAAFRPLSHVFPIGRFRHVKDNWDPILIIIALNALVSVCRIRGDQSMCLRCKLSWLKIYQRVDSNFSNFKVDHLCVWRLVCGIGRRAVASLLWCVFSYWRRCRHLRCSWLWHMSLIWTSCARYHLPWSCLTQTTRS